MLMKKQSSVISEDFLDRIVKEINETYGWEKKEVEDSLRKEEKN